MEELPLPNIRAAGLDTPASSARIKWEPLTRAEVCKVQPETRGDVCARARAHTHAHALPEDLVNPLFSELVRGLLGIPL